MIWYRWSLTPVSAVGTIGTTKQSSIEAFARMHKLLRPAIDRPGFLCGLSRDCCSFCISLRQPPAGNVSLSRRTMMIDGSLIARILILIVELLTKMKSQMRTRNVWGFLECGLKISLGSVVQGKWRRWYYSSNCCGMLGFLSRFLGSSTDRFVWSMTCMHCVNGKKIVLW